MICGGAVSQSPLGGTCVCVLRGGIECSSGDPGPHAPCVGGPVWFSPLKGCPTGQPPFSFLFPAQSSLPGEKALVFRTILDPVILSYFPPSPCLSSPPPNSCLCRKAPAQALGPQGFPECLTTGPLLPPSSSPACPGLSCCSSCSGPLSVPHMYENTPLLKGLCSCFISQ
jgi:hypothetical protein